MPDGGIIQGERYGHLIAISIYSVDHKSVVKWECKCDCGNIVIVRSHNLKTGNTKSCGCMKIYARRMKRARLDALWIDKFRVLKYKK